MKIRNLLATKLIRVTMKSEISFISRPFHPRQSTETYMIPTSMKPVPRRQPQNCPISIRTRLSDMSRLAKTSSLFAKKANRTATIQAMTVDGTLAIPHFMQIQ